MSHDTDREPIEMSALRSLSSVGRALWSDPEASRRNALETLTAVSLLSLTPERRLERAATVLLDRATRAGVAADSLALAASFYRLDPRERFVLAALHHGRWSYARIGRCLRVEREQVERLAWAARIKLAGPGRYPAAASPSGTSCPSYDPQRPWTQRFLDDEFEGGQEKLFLRNHLMVCDGCKGLFQRGKEFYYTVEANLPRAQTGELDREALELGDAIDRSEILKPGYLPSFGTSLSIFLSRREGKLTLALVALAALAKWLG